MLKGVERDLFTVFPDLPWPRIGHPTARRWDKLPLPPRPLRRHLKRPRSMADRRSAAPSPDDRVALRRILEIALSERGRLKAKSASRRSFDRIAHLAHGAL